MEIHVDYSTAPKEQFFIAVRINPKKCISFDCTIKGHRIVKQRLVETKPFPADAKLSAEWDTLIIKNGRFESKYHVKWVDMDEKDWLNGEIWETAWEKPLSDELTKQLLNYSELICTNYEHLDNYQQQMREFEGLLQREIKI